MGIKSRNCRKALLDKEREVIEYDKSIVVNRPPTLCAGCPHRSFFYELSKRKDTIITGDIGCYTLGGAEPLNAMDTTICMGASVSAGHGMERLIDRHDDDKRVVSVIGDSTFFHSGMTSLLDAVYNKSNTIVCVLDNRITAMTGHQDHPGTGYTLQGETTKMANIAEIAKALGVEHVKTVNPLELGELKEALDWAYSLDEPSVIISRWPCALKRLSEYDKKEFDYKPGKCEIDQEKCIGCKMCVNTGCPAIYFDKATKKSSINDTQCIGCELCMQVCPVKAISKVGE